MLDTSRNHEDLPWAELDRSIAEFNAQLPAPHKKHLVGVVVAVPNKNAPALAQLHLLAVQLADDFWTSVLDDFFELLRKVDFLHGGLVQ
jgi:hypothetical protein